MAAKKKSVPSKNKPGPWDDIARGASSVGGAVKRTIYSNPTNRNKASNLDKWLNGGRYAEHSLGDIAKGAGKGAKAVGKGAQKVGKLLAGPAPRIIKEVTEQVTPPKKTVRQSNYVPRKLVPLPKKNTPAAGARGGQPSRNIKPKPRTGKK